MEFWLMDETGDEDEGLRLPVPPSNFKINGGTIIDVETVNDIGEVALIGNEELRSITIDSFFPAQEYNFVDYRDFPKPYDCVDIINKWKNRQEPVRFIITETDINMDTAIEKFSYGEQDGSSDVYYTLQLREYRKIELIT